MLEAGRSHLSCFFADLRGNPEDVRGLLHDPDQQVVDVVFQLAHLTFLLADRFLLFEDQLNELVVGQLHVGKCGVRGLVFLWWGGGGREGETTRKLTKSAKRSNISEKYRDSLGGPVAKTPRSQCRGPRFGPQPGN